MAYDRTGTGRWVWVKTVGSAEDQLEIEWLENSWDLLERVWFPKHPRSLRGGDLLVYYAAGRGVFPAVVELVSSDVAPGESTRWPWTMAVRPRLVIPSLDDAPALGDSGLDPLRLRRQSHILLTAREWEGFRDTFLPPAASAMAQAA